jgi:dTDP-L-rhamnose 4-epimerase
MRVLVTGGAGFIGTHLCRHLVRESQEVTVLDSFSHQVHGGAQGLSSDLCPKVKLIKGQVQDRTVLFKALESQDAVIHLAAETGTGQSMYEVERYSAVNISGTSLLMEYLANHPKHGIRKLLLASSRAVYGEGKYNCRKCGEVYPLGRRVEDLKAGRFEPRCPQCQQECSPMASHEDSMLQPSSFYGLTKQVQEQIVSLFGSSLRVPTFVLRYQNVYGPGQSLKNPYTGILAIFANRARADLPINVFEDGLESRDFVYIDDVVSATWCCLTSDLTGAQVLNVGSGLRTSIHEVAQRIVQFFRSRSEIRVSGDFRIGDIRHNYADLRRVGELIGFAPKWAFRNGIEKFLEWVAGQPSECGTYEDSIKELKSRGLLLAATKS